MLGWCMWQLMHWLVGIERVKAWLSGWPLSPLGIVGSADWLCPSRPACA